MWRERRDTSADPKRQSGPVDPQRYRMGYLNQSGFPTFMGLPLAMTPEDLKAGKVDVAIVGTATDTNPVPGAKFGANQLRVLPDYMPIAPLGTDQHLRIDYLEAIKVVDYGNIAAHINLMQRSLEEHRKVVGEILSAAQPLIDRPTAAPARATSRRRSHAHPRGSRRAMCPSETSAEPSWVGLLASHRSAGSDTELACAPGRGRRQR
jgi:agmatinase